MAKSKKNTKKCRTFNRISYRERVIIENRYYIDWKSISNIARELKRPVSAVSREIGGKPRIGPGRYNADSAQTRVESNRAKQGRRTRFEYEPLRIYVVDKLKLGWSPEQIKLRLPIHIS